MSLKRLAAATFRPLWLYRYVVAAIIVYSLALVFAGTGQPKALWFGVGGTAFVSLIALLRAPRFPKARFVRRRRMESAISLLICLDLLSRFVWNDWIQLALFPIFLAIVYSGFRVRQLLVLLAAEAVLTFLRSGGFAVWMIDAAPQQLLLFVWTLLAMAFRLYEMKKRKEISERLRVYEREASGLDHRSAEVGATLRIDERKKAHLATMIREREKSFKNLLDILCNTFEPHTCALFLYEPNEEVFLLKEFVTDSDRFSEQPIQPPEGIFRALLKEQSAIRLVSASGELRGLNYYDRPPLVRSVVAFPLESGELLQGALILDRLDPSPFTDEDVETIERIAGQLCRSIDNAEALHAYFNLQEELSSFYAASNALNRSLKVDSVVETLLDATSKIAHYDWGLVVLHDEPSGKNIVAAEGGPDKTGWVGQTFACAVERGLISWVIQNQTPLSYNQFRSRSGKTVLFHRGLKVPNIFDSVLILPMQLKGENLGALFLAARKNHFFSRSVRNMLEVVTMLAGASLKNARMVGELEKLATTDGLTGLVNHRTFQENLANEIERAGRHPAPVSLLLVDIDHFKKFNDEYGHPVGDFVLKSIGQVLQKSVRKVDTVARYGGEEFAVILVNSTSAGAEQLAERIVQEVARSKFQQHGLTLRVTVSVGAATYPDDSATREELIECADRALYESKRSGRNRLTVYRPKFGKLSKDLREKNLIDATEDELRRTVDHDTVTV